MEIFKVIFSGSFDFKLMKNLGDILSRVKLKPSDKEKKTRWIWK